MRMALAETKSVAWMRLVRRAVYYALTVGAALLCSYWIISGRW
jgi:hypothetical protein